LAEPYVLSAVILNSVEGRIDRCPALSVRIDATAIMILT